MRNPLPPRVKRRIHNTTPYYYLTALQTSLRSASALDRRFVSLKPDGGSAGRVLLSYINDPFFLKPGEPVPIGHTHFWESREIANTFLELGYEVDVIRYSNRSFVPQEDYSLLIDSRFNLERLSGLLNSDCLRIMHADAAHCLFHNAAEARRLLELQQRRGVTLRPQRAMAHNLGIEHAHCLTILGNRFTIDTYRYADKPTYRVPVSTPVLYPWPDDKDFDRVRKNYMWFGSGGFVHKGLDLVLEAFAGMPDYHLTICGPIANPLERDFVDAFRKELYETPNIHTVGWTDISSAEFVRLANGCAGLVYPSCSEGGGASVLSCMHAGMIPIVSYESSVDIEPAYGAVLENCSVDTIRSSVRAVSELLVRHARTHGTRVLGIRTRKPYKGAFRGRVQKSRERARCGARQAARGAAGPSALASLEQQPGGDELVRGGSDRSERQAGTRRNVEQRMVAVRLIQHP